MTRRPGWDGILFPSETILWQGQPDPTIRRSDLNPREMLFGAFFSGFALFWMAMAAQGGGVMALFGLPFVAIGLRMLGGAPYGAYVRRRTWYTLTNQRAFIARDLPWKRRSLDSFPLTGATVFDYDDAEDLPTIWFTSGYRADATGRVRGKQGFERLTDARGVYAQMRDVQRSNP